jgi:hypothetical protein
MTLITIFEKKKHIILTDDSDYLNNEKTERIYYFEVIMSQSFCVKSCMIFV